MGGYSSCKPSVSLIRYSVDGESVVAGAAKLTLSSKDMNTILSNIGREVVSKWVRELVRRGHGSPLEHSVYSFEITCSRVASHQLVRHRIASYTQLSQRRGDKILRNIVLKTAQHLGLELLEKHSSRRVYYIEYAKTLDKLLSIVDDVSFHDLLEIACQGFIVPPSVVKNRDKEFIVDLLLGLKKYYEALSRGYHPEDARFLLPQAVKTRVYVTMNSRELIENFLPLRTCRRAQWEVRYIAWMMLKELLSVHPILFSYAGPRCVLYENRVRQEPCRLIDFIKGSCGFVIEKCPELTPRESIRACILDSLKDPWEEEYVLFNYG